MTPRLRAGHVLLTGGIALVIPAVLFLLVDVLNVAGTRDAISAHVGRRYELWPVLYQNNSPVEWVQWVLLGTAALLSAGAAAHARARGWTRHARLFGLLAVGLMLMLIEDAGDPRHAVAERIILDVLVVEESRTVRLTVDGVWFAILAAPMLLAVRDWPVLRGDRTTLGLLGGGYAFYAVASLSSWSSSWGWYHRVGAWIMDDLLGGRLLSPATEGFWFMDRVYEESVELVAITLLCAALASYRQRWLAARPAAPGPAPRGDGRAGQPASSAAADEPAVAERSGTAADRSRTPAAQPPADHAEASDHASSTTSAPSKR